MTHPESCPRIEALSALADGELPADERTELEGHVAGCPLCAPALADLRRLRTLFAALPEPAGAFDVAPEVDRRIGAAAGGAARRGPRPPRPRWWQVALAAPGAAIPLAVGVWLGSVAFPAAVPATVAAPTALAAGLSVFATSPPGAICAIPGSCGGPSR